MVLNVHRNHKDYEGRGGGDTEGGEEWDYIPITTLSPPEWLLHQDGQQWETFWCFINCEGQSQASFINCEGQSHKPVSTDHNFWRELTAEVDSNRSPSAHQPKALTLGQTGSHFGGDSVALVIVSLFACLQGSWVLPVPLQTPLGTKHKNKRWITSPLISFFIIFNCFTVV